MLELFFHLQVTITFYYDLSDLLQKQINAVPFNVIKSMKPFAYRLLFSSTKHIVQYTFCMC